MMQFNYDTGEWYDDGNYVGEAGPPASTPPAESVPGPTTPVPGGTIYTGTPTQVSDIDTGQPLTPDPALHPGVYPDPTTPPPTTPQPKPAPTPNPNPNPTGGGGGGTGGGGISNEAGRVPGTTEYPIAGGLKSFSYPDWAPPNENFNMTAPAKPTVTPFAYADWQMPTGEDALKADPGYKFRDEQMTNGVLNRASAQGLLGTTGTLADLMSYKGGLASQEYGNFVNRSKSAYDTNRSNAFGNWQANAGQSNTGFQQDMTSYLAGEAAKEQDWERSQQAYTTNLNKTAAGYGLNLDTSQLNLGRDQAQMGNLLSLYSLMTRNLPTYSPVPVPTVAG